MRVLHVISSGGMYGAEKMLLNLLAHLPATGVQPRLAVFRNGRNPRTEIAVAAAAAGIPVDFVDCRSRLDLRAMRDLRNCIDSHQIDLLHTHGYKSNMYGLWAAQRKRVPVIATCHNWTNDTRALRLYSIADRYILRRFNRVVGVSSTVASTLADAGVPGDRIRTIANGVPINTVPARTLHQFGGTPIDGRIVVGLVGRLVPQKGFQFLLRGAQKVISEFPEALFVFVGDGFYRRELEQLAVECGVARHVVFTGERADMDAVFRSFDIFVLPSLREGMPVTVLEAMAASVPVIATQVGGIPKLLENGTGILVDPEDADGLAENLISLIADPIRRQALGGRGRASIERGFSAERMAENYAQLYREVAGMERSAAFPVSTEQTLRGSNQPPPVSVIIPARDAGKFLAQCLKSLASDGLPPGIFEVVVADNGSKDDTLEVARSWTNRLCLRILECPGMTIAGVRNAAAEVAAGSYLAFLDADCLIPPGWFDNILRHFADTDAGVIGGRYAIPGGSTWVARTWHGYQKHKVGRTSYVPGGDLIVRKELFNSVGGFDPTLRTNEDYEFCQRIVSSGAGVYSFPDIAVCHLGEAQTLGRFFKKQRWHGTDVLRVFLRALPAFRNAKAVAFAVYFLLCMIGTGGGIGLAFYGHYELLLVSFFATLAAPVAASAMACLPRRNFTRLAPLAALFLVYGLARASSLLLGFRNPPPRTRNA